MLAFTNISCTVKQLWVVSIHQTMFLFHFDLLFLQQLHFFPWQSYIISSWIWVPFPLCLSLKVTVGDSWEFTSSKDTILKLHPPKQPHSAVWNKTEPVSGTTSKWPIFPVDLGFSCSTILITIINKVSEKPLLLSISNPNVPTSCYFEEIFCYVILRLKCRHWCMSQVATGLSCPLRWNPFQPNRT